MGEVKPESVDGVWPTVKPSVNGGASGMLTNGVFQAIDSTKEASQSTFEKNARGDKWGLEEDVALMSAWCVASKLQPRGKNQKKTSLWVQIKKLYDEARAKNSEKLKPRTDKQMNGRWRRLNENANKWINAYRKAYKQNTSKMSLKDIENEAHKIYAAGGSKFKDYIVFNEVMCNHPNWKLMDDFDTTPPYSGGPTSQHSYEKKEKCEV